MAIQLAHYRLHGKFVSTYESGSTRHFVEGRTETIRPCSAASCAFVERMCGSEGSWREATEEVQGLLRSAIQAHTDYVKLVFQVLPPPRFFLHTTDTLAERGGMWLVVCGI